MAVATQPALVPAHQLVFEPNELPKIRSNHGSEVDPASIGWLRPTSVDTPLEEMRRRFKADGYVYIKGLIPRKDVLDMREQ